MTFIICSIFALWIIIIRNYKIQLLPHVKYRLRWTNIDHNYNHLVTLSVEFPVLNLIDLKSTVTHECETWSMTEKNGVRLNTCVMTLLLDV
jgi:hypothetical protein